MNSVAKMIACAVLFVASGVGLAQSAAPATGGKGYLIGEITVTDPVAYKQYADAAGVLVAKYGGKYVVRGGQTVGLEGATVTGRVVVIEFKSLEAAKTFEFSDEYQKIAPIRLKASHGRLFLVEGTGL